MADKIDQETFEEIVHSSNELLLLDEVVREGVLRLTQDRNDIVERSLHLLIDISGIQSEFTETGSLLAAVDADLHSNKLDGFKHLHRLKNMLWAYGATVVEVIRRREFAKHFLGKSQSLAELMAKLSASEWKRRQFYRSDISSLLPWEVKGMDDKPPSLEITTPRVSNEGMADLGLADLESLYELLDLVDLRLREESEGADAGPSPVPEVKAALQSLAAALQDLDDEFIHLVNAQLLNQDDDEEGSDEEGDESGSDTSIRARKRLRRRQRLTASLAAANDEELAKLRRELATAKAANEEAEKTLRADHESQALSLKTEIETLKKQVEAGKSDVYKLEAEKREAQGKLDTLSADLDLERERRLNMVDEVNQLRRDLEQSHRSEAEAKQEAMEEVDRVAELEAQAHELHVELDEAKSARIDASNRIEALLSEGSSVEGELRTAQARIDELTEQLSNAHADAAKARESAAEVEATKERQIRSHRAEADGDRAILEEKVRTLKAELDAKEQLLDKQAAIANRAEQSRAPDREAIELLRGQLRAADVAHEEIVKEMEHARELADEAEAARREVEAGRQQLLERARELLSKTSLLRKTVRAMPNHSSSVTHRHPPRRKATQQAQVTIMRTLHRHRRMLQARLQRNVLSHCLQAVYRYPTCPSHNVKQHWMPSMPKRREPTLRRPWKLCVPLTWRRCTTRSKANWMPSTVWFASGRRRGSRPTTSSAKRMQPPRTGLPSATFKPATWHYSCQHATQTLLQDRGLLSTLALLTSSSTSKVPLRSISRRGSGS